MTSELTDKQVAEFHQQLKERFYTLRQEIRQEMLNSDDEQFIDLAGRVHDLEEASVAALLVDINLANIDRHILEITEIDQALIRIAEKTYGVCTDCDTPIDAQRLAANPAAKRCLRCQDKHEKTFVQPGHASI